MTTGRDFMGEFHFGRGTGSMPSPRFDDEDPSAGLQAEAPSPCLRWTRACFTFLESSSSLLLRLPIPSRTLPGGDLSNPGPAPLRQDTRQTTGRADRRTCFWTAGNAVTAAFSMWLFSVPSRSAPSTSGTAPAGGAEMGSAKSTRTGNACG